MGELALARHQFTEALDWGRRAVQANPHRAANYGIVGDAAPWSWAVTTKRSPRCKRWWTRGPTCRPTPVSPTSANCTATSQ
ncbi:MAG: hypothetical protein U0531_11240 [Dehalococcoidia bacterium]